MRAKRDDARKGLAAHQRNLRKVEAEIQRLIAFLAEGNGSDYVKTTLQSLEAKAADIKATIADEWRAQKPGSLPSVDAILTAFANIEARLDDDVHAGREYLRKMFKDSAIVMLPQGKSYVAKSKVFASAPSPSMRTSRRTTRARPGRASLPRRRRRRSGRKARARPGRASLPPHRRRRSGHRARARRPRRQSPPRRRRASSTGRARAMPEGVRKVSAM